MIAPWACTQVVVCLGRSARSVAAFWNSRRHQSFGPPIIALTARDWPRSPVQVEEVVVAVVS